MPDVLVEVRGNWLDDEKTRFLEAIHSAMVDTIKIPRDDKVLRFHSYALEDFVIPPGRGERFTRIEWRATHRCQNSSDRGACHERGIRGGQAASDIDLGFEVSV
jgi:hypothetical protein